MFVLSLICLSAANAQPLFVKTSNADTDTQLATNIELTEDVNEAHAMADKDELFIWANENLVFVGSDGARFDMSLALEAIEIERADPPPTEA